MYFQDFQVFAMWNFIPGVVEPLPKKPKTNEEKLEVQRKYENKRQFSRQYSFLFINAQYIVDSPESKLNFRSNNIEIVGPLEILEDQ